MVLSRSYVESRETKSFGPFLIATNEYSVNFFTKTFVMPNLLRPMDCSCKVIISAYRTIPLIEQNI